MPGYKTHIFLAAPSISHFSELAGDVMLASDLRSCTKNKRKPRHQLTASPAARPPRPPSSRADYQMCKQRPDPRHIVIIEAADKKVLEPPGLGADE